jgi:hypothetical protein
MALAACRGAMPFRGGMDDSTYVHAMGDLLHVDQARRSRARPMMPPAPDPAHPNQRAESAYAVFVADTLRLAKIDSADRLRVLAQYHVTPLELETKARALVADAKRSRALWDAIQKYSGRPMTPPPSAGVAPASGALPPAGVP